MGVDMVDDGLDGRRAGAPCTMMYERASTHYPMSITPEQQTTTRFDPPTQDIMHKQHRMLVNKRVKAASCEV